MKIKHKSKKDISPLIPPYNPAYISFWMILSFFPSPVSDFNCEWAPGNCHTVTQTYTQAEKL
jgi:hypothetical protein